MQPNSAIAAPVNGVNGTEVPSIDLTRWYTEEQAAQRLGISVRSFQRLVADGKLSDFDYAPQRQRRPRGPGRKPESVFNPDEVDALAQMARTHVVPAPYAGPQARTEDEIPPALEFALQMMARVAQVIEARSERLIEPESTSVDPQKLYLSIDEAAAVSGLSKSLLRRLCEAQQIGFKDGRSWRIPRNDLANSAALTEMARLDRRAREALS